MTKVGIIGASGFTGAELLRLCSAHPHFEVAFATGDSQAGTRAADLYPSLRAAYPDLVFATWDPKLADEVEVAFLALPHGASQSLAAALVDRVPHLVDLSADFRLRDASTFAEWYGGEHQAPELIDRFVYGLPELFPDAVAGATHIASPGCYPTAAALALAPLVRAGMIDDAGIVIDAASGVSGAGRAPKPGTTFCAVDEDFSAYGLLDHRHTPEIEQAIGASVLFTPHLAPMNRGILATCYARPAADGLTTESVRDALREAYLGQPFVVVVDEPPHTKATLGSNVAQVSAVVDARTGWVVALCALDNLVKGASGQAVQCANLITGLDQTSGLPTVGMMP